MLLCLVCLQTLAGGRPAAMANAFVAMYDIWSMHHNQAGLARTNNPGAGVSTRNHYLLNGMQSSALALALPAGKGVVGLAAWTFGNNQFRESKTGLAYAVHIGPGFSAGVQLTYLRFAIGNQLGKKGQMICEAGAIVEIIHGLFLGAHVFNPLNTYLLPKENLFMAEAIPSTFRTGLAWHVSDQLSITTEVYKDIRYTPRFRVGIEYQPGNHLFLRTGLETNPMSNSFGFGLARNRFELDFSAAYHHILGYSPSVSLQYIIQ